MTGVNVKPELLRWAIDRSGLSFDDLRERFPKLDQWLSSEKLPTLKQLQDFAKKTMVPLGYLFLNSPPQEELRIPDYRTRKNDRVPRPSPNLIDTIHDMQRRQDWMRDYLLEEGHEPLPFVGSASLSSNVIETANSIRETLGLAEDWTHRTGSTENALRIFRDRIERAGILVFLNGIVGNNTSRPLNVEEFQGFVFADPIVPLVFVNSADFKNAQMFTLAHELAHVWVAQSALFNNLLVNDGDDQVETFCNRVAAEFLVPGKLLKEILGTDSQLEGRDFLNLAKLFRVSPIVIARRCLELGLIVQDKFFAFYRRYMDEVNARTKPDSGGGNFWNTQNTRLGKRFGRAVIAAALEGRLSFTDAYSLTNLSGQTFDKYADRLSKELSK